MSSSRTWLAGLTLLFCNSSFLKVWWSMYTRSHEGIFWVNVLILMRWNCLPSFVYRLAFCFLDCFKLCGAHIDIFFWIGCGQSFILCLIKYSYFPHELLLWLVDIVLHICFWRMRCWWLDFCGCSLNSFQVPLLDTFDALLTVFQLFRIELAMLIRKVLHLETFLDYFGVMLFHI